MICIIGFGYLFSLLFLIAISGSEEMISHPCQLQLKELIFFSTLNTHLLVLEPVTWQLQVL